MKCNSKGTWNTVRKNMTTILKLIGFLFIRFWHTKRRSILLLSLQQSETNWQKDFVQCARFDCLFSLHHQFISFMCEFNKIVLKNSFCHSYSFTSHFKIVFTCDMRVNVSFQVIVTPFVRIFQISLLLLC